VIAARDLRDWIRRHPRAAVRLFVWGARHPARVRLFVAWVLGQAHAGVDGFVATHPGWPALNVILQLGRGSDGRRRVVSVAEITGLEGSTIVMQELFRFEQRGVDAAGHVLGDFLPTGIRPRVMDRLERAGVDPARLVGSWS
jgi:hypothetical protein